MAVDKTRQLVRMLIPTKPVDLDSFTDTFPAVRTTSVKLWTLAVLRTLFGCLKFGAFITADSCSSTDTQSELLDLGSSTDTFPAGEKLGILWTFFSPAGKVYVKLPRSTSFVGIKICVRRTAKVRSSIRT